MKTILLLLSFIVLGLTASAQTAYSTMNSHPKGPSGLSIESQNRVWVGGKLLKNIQGDANGFFQLSGRFIYTPYEGQGFAFPIVTDVALNNIDSFSLDNGVEIGVMPWLKWIDNADMTVLIHGGLSYTMPPKSDLIDDNRLTALIGLEVALMRINEVPTTLSVAPMWTFLTGDDKRDAFGLEVTGIIPVAPGFQVFVGGIVPFQENDLLTKGLNVGVAISDILGR